MWWWLDVARAGALASGVCGAPAFVEPPCAQVIDAYAAAMLDEGCYRANGFVYVEGTDENDTLDVTLQGSRAAIFGDIDGTVILRGGKLSLDAKVRVDGRLVLEDVIVEANGGSFDVRGELVLVRGSVDLGQPYSGFVGQVVAAKAASFVHLDQVVIPGGPYPTTIVQTEGEACLSDTSYYGTGSIVDGLAGSAVHVVGADTDGGLMVSTLGTLSIRDSSLSGTGLLLYDAFTDLTNTRMCDWWYAPAIYQVGGTLAANGFAASADGFAGTRGEVWSGDTFATATFDHTSVSATATVGTAFSGSATVTRSVVLHPNIGATPFYQDTLAAGSAVVPYGVRVAPTVAWLAEAPYPTGYSESCPSLRVHPLLNDPAAFGLAPPTTTDPLVYAEQLRRGEVWGAGGAAWWDMDVDGDGWVSAFDCFDDEVGLYLPGAFVNPEAYEACPSGYLDVDSNCDGVFGVIGFADDDGDGYGGVALSTCTGYGVLVGGDCDDGNGYVRPYIPEVCNLVDDDCDQLIDEGLRDDDADGLCARVDCDDGVPWAPEQPCNGIDDDCDPYTVDDVDTDGDGLACDADCDPLDGAVGPVEMLYVDGDRDGLGVGAAVARCPGEGWASAAGDCDDSDAEIGAPVLRYADGDEDGFGDGDAVLVCPQEPQFADVAGDCNDKRDDVYPGAREVIDGVDGNCDGFEDSTWVQGGCRGGCQYAGASPAGWVAALTLFAAAGRRRRRASATAR